MLKFKDLHMHFHLYEVKAATWNVYENFRLLKKTKKKLKGEIWKNCTLCAGVVRFHPKSLLSATVPLPLPSLLMNGCVDLLAACTPMHKMQAHEVEMAFFAAAGV